MKSISMNQENNNKESTVKPGFCSPLSDFTLSFVNKYIIKQNQNKIQILLYSICLGKEMLLPSSTNQ